VFEFFFFLTKKKKALTTPLRLSGRRQKTLSLSLSLSRASAIKQEREMDKTNDEEEEENDAVATMKKPSMHFIVQNVSKKHNIGTICRNCTAFDVKSMHLVGNAHYNVFGSQGSDAHVRIEHHPTLSECRDAVKKELKCEEILGVEITEESVDVAKYPWKGNTAFVLGNEGHGLTPQQKKICDGFVYIKQYGVGTASLNVAVASSIVMHEFAKYHDYSERAREGEKFVVAEKPLLRRPKGVAVGVGWTPEDVRKERELKRAELANDDECEEVNVIDWGE